MTFYRKCVRYFIKSLCKGEIWYVKSALRRKLYLPMMYFGRPYLRNLDIHVTDHCNLNCKGCSLISPLAKEWFCDVEQTEKDLSELSKKVQILNLSLIGGEPLLHPEITELVRVVRKAYPKSDITVVTNGSLLPKMTDDFWKVCRENRVVFMLSVYPPLRTHLNEYLKLSKGNGIHVMLLHNTRAWDRMRFSFKTEENMAGIHYRLCKQKDCYKLVDSKLYLCPLFSLKHYNRYFNENHPTIKGYDIYKYSGKELVQFMKRPDPACRYCTWVVKNETTQWGYSKREKSEWCEDV